MTDKLKEEKKISNSYEITVGYLLFLIFFKDI